jgi:hemerythrin
MGIFDWKPEYSVGDTRLDREHRELFMRARALHKAMFEGRGATAVDGLLESLVDYTNTHFRGEETWMARLGYPQTAEHRREHEEFRQMIRAMSHQRNTNPVALMKYLGTWLLRHILESDQKVVAFRKQEVRGPELQTKP